LGFCAVRVDALVENFETRFAIEQKIQLNRSASSKLATVSVFWICLIIARLAPVLLTIW
jgi:hypothetical protein